ncbi:MAG TPA: hypothetical protein VML75_22185 [Kofleriaceae bacterium]|nr:hypothetical protein [Kofleriaceae bacterium]
MKRARSSFTALFLTALIGLGAGACATSDAGGGAADADPFAPDADPLAPDADPNAPDADPLAPDANPATNADASSCPKQPCSLAPQCGCSASQACDLKGSELSTGGTECRAVNTAGTETSTCSAPESCAAGYVCLGTPGHCRRWCAGDGDCTGAGALCLLQVTYSGGDVPGAVTCSKSCDPVGTVNPTGCPPSDATTRWGCHIFADDPDGTFGNGDERFLTDCTTAPLTGGGDGVACTSNSNCAPGYDCINVGTNQCKQTCIYGGGVCAVGTCVRFAEPRPVIGGVEYGVCN